MSLQRLHNFLKDNFHDVKDYWIENKMIKYIRVISRKNGCVYFVRLNDQHVKILEDQEYYQKSNFYYLEKSFEEQENLDYLYDIFLRAFPEYNYKYLLFNGYYLMQEKNTIYQIKNLSNTDYFGFYLFLDIEWFFENVYIVNYEIEKIMIDIQSKLEKMYLGFLPNYTNFCNNDEYNQKVDSVWNYYQSHFKDYDNTRHLYLDICILENNTINDIDFNEKISDSDDLNVKQVLYRQFQKKKLADKLDQIIHLKSKTLDKILFHYCITWKIILKFLVLISKFTKLQSDFFTMIHELENIVPRNRITYFS